MPMFLRMLLVSLFVINCVSFQSFHSKFRSNKIVTSNSRFMTAVDDKSVFEAIKEEATKSIDSAVVEGTAPKEFGEILRDFIDEYAHSFLEAGESSDNFKFHVTKLLTTVNEAILNPYEFKANHMAIREPFDYYKWGNDFLKPLVIMEESKMFGLENAKKIQKLVSKGDNVVILSNHQTEADPQVLSILLQEAGMGELAEKVIFIAGHKVTTDPVAIPFSMGRNLLCIHSKKHIKNPPEDIPKKQAQNLKSMQAMSELVGKGGQIFWVAPSGGRDRPDETGTFVVSPFDFKALDMFKLIAMQSGKSLHFFPMAMYSNELVPPPDSVSSTVGEARSAKRGAVSINFLDPTHGMGGLKDKKFTAEVQSNVESAYNELVKFHDSVNGNGR